MIKSHLLYQLSYVPKTEPERKMLPSSFHGSGPILTHQKQKCKKKYSLQKNFFHAAIFGFCPKPNIAFLCLVIWPVPTNNPVYRLCPEILPLEFQTDMVSCQRNSYFPSFADMAE